MCAQVWIRGKNEVYNTNNVTVIYLADKGINVIDTNGEMYTIEQYDSEEDMQKQFDRVLYGLQEKWDIIDISKE